MDMLLNCRKLMDKKTLSNRIGLTLFILACARLGTYVPIPGVDQEFLYEMGL